MTPGLTLGLFLLTVVMCVVSAIAADRQGHAHRSRRWCSRDERAGHRGASASSNFSAREPAKVQALKGVSLSLHGGELTLLMGPSGSGKTTLLSVLGCMLTPTEGTVRVCGQATTDAGPGATRQAAARSYRLRLPVLSSVSDADRAGQRPPGAGRARRALPAKRSPRRQGRAGHASAWRTRSNAFPRELSGGEQQRVAIARAIVGDASAILADEPTAALDSENGHAIMTMLAEIAKDPARGVLVVTHDPRILPFAEPHRPHRGRTYRRRGGGVGAARMPVAKAKVSGKAMISEYRQTYHAPRIALFGTGNRRRRSRGAERSAASGGRQALAGGRARPGRAASGEIKMTASGDRQ